MQLLNNNSPVVNHQYAYDIQNRLASVENGTHAAHYTRLDGSGLLSNTAIKTSGGTTLLSTDRAYDVYYRMTSIASTAGATTRSYAYVYNDKDQRSRCTLADGSYWEYAYDDKGQVIGGVKYDAGGIAIPGMSFGYDYDGIGNRKQETRGIEELKLLYASNLVNQYTQITTPGVVPVAGEADADTIVKALRNDAGSPSSGEQAVIARRDGKYFTAAFTKVDNAASAKEIPYTVYAIRDDATANKQYIQKKSSSYTVPKREQTPTSDADGNMLTLLNDGVLWNLAWNGENRLIAAEAATCRLEFTYDYMGRRVNKQVYTGSVGNWTLASESKYVYDGYYQIAEFDGSDNMLKSYLRAGGEVYAVTDTNQSVTYFYMTDGNKNIMALVDASGNVQADYTYDPFGRIIAKSGAYADANPFRFSSEFHDNETGLVYYNYRYYSPDLGRWTRRDPIEEQGGVNLYGMVGNAPVNKSDYFGLYGEWAYYKHDISERFMYTVELWDKDLFFDDHIMDFHYMIGYSCDNKGTLSFDIDHREIIYDRQGSQHEIDIAVWKYNNHEVEFTLFGAGSWKKFNHLEGIDHVERILKKIPSGQPMQPLVLSYSVGAYIVQGELKALKERAVFAKKILVKCECTEIKKYGVRRWDPKVEIGEDQFVNDGDLYWKKNNSNARGVFYNKPKLEKLGLY